MLLCRPTQEKIGRDFGKNAGEWTGRVEIRKNSLAVSVACMGKTNKQTNGRTTVTRILCFVSVAYSTITANLAKPLTEIRHARNTHIPPSLTFHHHHHHHHHQQQQQKQRERERETNLKMPVVISPNYPATPRYSRCILVLMKHFLSQDSAGAQDGREKMAEV